MRIIRPHIRRIERIATCMAGGIFLSPPPGCLDTLNLCGSRPTAGVFFAGHHAVFELTHPDGARIELVHVNIPESDFAGVSQRRTPQPALNCQNRPARAFNSIFAGGGPVPLSRSYDAGRIRSRAGQLRIGTHSAERDHGRHKPRRKGCRRRAQCRPRGDGRHNCDFLGFYSRTFP
jgi:hypothetical protein